jgi:hypothetical protein
MPQPAQPVHVIHCMYVQRQHALALPTVAAPTHIVNALAWGQLHHVGFVSERFPHHQHDLLCQDTRQMSLSSVLIMAEPEYESGVGHVLVRVHRKHRACGMPCNSPPCTSDGSLQCSSVVNIHGVTCCRLHALGVGATLPHGKPPSMTARRWRGNPHANRMGQSGAAWGNPRADLYAGGTWSNPRATLGLHGETLKRLDGGSLPAALAEWQHPWGRDFTIKAIGAISHRWA